VITDGRAFQTAGVLIADIIQVKRGKNVGCPELLSTSSGIAKSISNSYIMKKKG